MNEVVDVYALDPSYASLTCGNILYFILYLSSVKLPLNIVTWVFCLYHFISDSVSALQLTRTWPNLLLYLILLYFAWECHTVSVHVPITPSFFIL